MNDKDFTCEQVAEFLQKLLERAFPEADIAAICTEEKKEQDTGAQDTTQSTPAQATGTRGTR